MYRFLQTDFKNALANVIGLEIRVAHYLPSCSKHNSIEHQVFPHATRECEGVIFTSVSRLQRLMQRPQTRTGLGVSVDILAGTCPTGCKTLEHLKPTLNLIQDTILPKLNNTISPKT